MDVPDSCQVPKCERLRVSAEYCRLHYDRWKKTGSTDDPYPEITSRVCADCKVEKPASEYSRKGKGKWGQQKYQSYCKACENIRKKNRPLTGEQLERQRAYRRDWAVANRERLSQQQAARRAADPEFHKWLSYQNHLWKKYRMRWEEYEQLCESQDNKCAVCRAPLSFEPKRPAVDHDHTSGQIRGLLCEACNQGLGNFRDDPDILRAAAKYLEKERILPDSPERSQFWRLIDSERLTG